MRHPHSQLDSVPLPGDGSGRVRVPAPDVGNEFSVEANRRRGTNVIPVERIRERLSHCGEARIADAMNFSRKRNVTVRAPARAPGLTGRREAR